MNSDRIDSLTRRQIEILRLLDARRSSRLVQEWSNGQTEGQVNKLKLLKRQMYGRAGFDLLRRRLPHAA